MIITSIAIKNFRGIRELDLQDCQPRMLVLGFNRSGKTSLLDAIRAVFLGKVQGADGKALEVREWIGPWARTAEVTIGFAIGDESFEARMRVSKTVSLEIIRHGLPTWIGPPKEVRGALWKHLGVSQRHRECAMMPRAFLVGDDLGQMISDLGGSGVDPAKLDALLGENAAWFRAFAAQARVAPDSPDNLMAIGAAMYERRTELNAKVREFDATIKRHADVLPPQNAKGAILGVANMPIVKRAIDDLATERDELVAELGAAQNVPDSQEIADALAKARTERAALKYDPERKAIVDAEARLKRATASVKDAETKVNEAKVANSNATESHRRAQNDLAGFRHVAVPEAGTCCPACRQKISKAARDAFAEWAAAQVATAQERLNAAQDLSASTLAALQPLRDAERAARDEEQAAKSAVERANRQHNETVTRLAALDARIESLSSAQPVPGPVADIERDIAGIDARIAAAKNALTALNAIAERQQAEEAREQTLLEIDRLKWAIPLFHNDRKGNHASALNQLGGDAQAAFLDACNAQLEPFGVALGVDTSGKALAVTFGGTDTDTRIPVTQVSGAEMLLAEWAVATAFAGGGLVLLDEFNRLDGKNNPLMIECLEQHEGCIWVASAYSKDDDPDVDQLREALPAFGVVWMDQGAAVAGEVAA